ncbi:MAG: 2-dehydro-3-deoxy-6-phosphogalactonate aldolase [Lentisphaeraceae bacterium]|nr:2-dehydro-3-deoxy-6-phosphogalactonate aldolase [Lentisphaeraceae bacterium]
MDKVDYFQELPIVAILRGIKPEDAVAVTQSLYDAGIRIVEVPLNSPEPFLSIEKIVAQFGDKMLVGAGTVLTIEQVQKLHDLGGKLVVSPNMNPEVIQLSNELNMQSFPGVMTVTEAISAIDAGASGLKLFPGNIVGMNFIKAAKAILPKKLPILAVGGVDDQNILDWQKAGADGFGLGSSLYKPKMTLDEIYKQALSVVNKLKAIS